MAVRGGCVLTYLYYNMIYRVSRENIPVNRRGGLATRTKTSFFAVLTILIKKIIKNHEINEN